MGWSTLTVTILIVTVRVDIVCALLKYRDNGLTHLLCHGRVGN